jgi:septum formation protein
MFSSYSIDLGSSSSNRQKILQLVEWSYDIMIPDIDEKAFRHEDPLFLPVIIAKAKAAAIFERLSDQSPFILLTADQIVLFDSDVREKPVNEEEAIKFLSSYSNRSVSTISAVVATHYPSGKALLCSSCCSPHAYYRESC